MAGSSADSKGNSLPYHVENERNEHLNDSFAVTPANGSGYFHQEMVKQTMLLLEVEATLKEQMYELRRLEKIQSDLMAVQCQREELNGYSEFVDASQSRSYSSHAPSGDASRVRQVDLSSGHDIGQPYKKSMKGNGLEHSLNGVPSRHTNSSPAKRSLDLQFPASTDADDSDDDVVILWEKPPPASTDAGDGDVVILWEKPPPVSTDAGDSDDDVVILWEKPAKSLPRTNSSVLVGNVNLNLEGSSHMNSWISGLQPSHGSGVNVLNKEVGESSNSMKITNFRYVGTSAPRRSSAGVNLNPPSLQDNLKEKGIDESSGSQFFGGDKKMEHNNSYIHSREDQSNSMSWFKQKQDGVGSSRGHYMPSFSTCNPQIRAAPSSNATLKSPWQSSSTNTPRHHRIDVEMPFAQNGFSMNSVRLPTLAEYCRQYHPSKIHAKAQHQKHSASHDCLKDINLNVEPRDITTTPEQEGENTPMDILWIRKRLLEMKKSQVSSSCANGHSQILLGSTTHSEGSTRIFGFPISTTTGKESGCSSTLPVGTSSTSFGFPISTTTGKESGCSSTLPVGTSSTSLVKCEADMGKFQNEKDETNVRSLIDLNVALPFMDDLEMDVHQSGGDTVPQEPDGSSDGSLDIGAAKTLLPVCKEEFQAGSPQGNVLLWFAHIATSEMNTFVHSSESGGNPREEHK